MSESESRRQKKGTFYYGLQRFYIYVLYKIIASLRQYSFLRHDSSIACRGTKHRCSSLFTVELVGGTFQHHRSTMAEARAMEQLLERVKNVALETDDCSFQSPILSLSRSLLGCCSHCTLGAERCRHLHAPVCVCVCVCVCVSAADARLII